MSVTSVRPVRCFVLATELERWIKYAASPRASLAFDRCSRVLAWLDGRDYVSPEDVQQLAHEILRHRILLSYQDEADGVRHFSSSCAMLAFPDRQLE